MEFLIKLGAPAGSVDAIMKDDGVYRVMSVFGDGCLEYYGLDIRQKRAIYNAKTVRQVQSFVSEYGVDDSITIVKKLFSPAYQGLNKGNAVGVSLFTTGYRWFANRLLLEASIDKKVEDNLWSKF